MTYPFAPVMYIVPFLFEDGESSSEEKLGYNIDLWLWYITGAAAIVQNCVA